MLKSFDMKSLDDAQKMNQANMDQAMKSMGEFGKTLQTVTSEMSDYAKRSFEDGTQTFEKHEVQRACPKQKAKQI